MKMSLKAQGLVWLLLRQGRLSLYQIQEICTDGKDGVKSAISELKKMGFVKLVECRLAGKFGKYYYQLTVEGKTACGIAANGISIHGENGVFTESLSDRENPLAENPSSGKVFCLSEDAENEGIKLTANGKSATDDEKNGIYNNISNKGSIKSIIDNITLNSQELLIEGKSVRKKVEKKPALLFRETPFVTAEDGMEQFKKALVGRNPGYELADLDHYYHAVLNWSDSKENRKIDWIATAANFILSDERKGGFKRAKTNLQHDTGTKVRGADAERVARRTARIINKLGGHL